MITPSPTPGSQSINAVGSSMSLPNAATPIAGAPCHPQCCNVSGLRSASESSTRALVAPRCIDYEADSGGRCTIHRLTEDC